MSLHELLDINEIVFGVNKPKIRPFFCERVRQSSGSITLFNLCPLKFYKSSDVLKNIFIYTGSVSYINAIFRNTEGGYRVYNITISDYICIYDLFRRAELEWNDYKFTAVGINTVIPAHPHYRTIPSNILVKGTDNYTIENFPSLSVDDDSAQRFYIVEYDRYRVLDF